MIRPLRPDDMQDLAKLLGELHAKSMYRSIKWSAQIVLSRIAMLSTRGFVRVAEHDGQLTGVIAGLVDEHWWADPQRGARYATDLVFYSKHRGDGATMVREFVEWALERPRVITIEMAINSGMVSQRAADRFYTQLGFERRGSFYVMDHPKMKELEAAA